MAKTILIVGYGPGVSSAVADRFGAEVVVERGAGEAAGYPDAEYTDKGARLAASREELQAVPGLPAKPARDIHALLHRAG